LRCCRFLHLSLIAILLLCGCAPAAAGKNISEVQVHLASPRPVLALPNRTPTRQDTPVLEATVPAKATPTPKALNSYCLWPGDTLTSIAGAAQVDLTALEDLNPKASRYAGSTLYLPAGSLPPERWSLPAPVIKGMNGLPFGVSGYYLGADNRQKRVALTFDIGYVPEEHDRMVWLHDQGIPATYFVLGISVSRHPEIVQDVLSNGHSLGNHSWDHLNFQDLTQAQMETELQKTEDAVKTASSDATTLPFFRAPFGAIDSRVSTIARQMGYHIIGWTVDSQDWMDGATGEQVFSRVTGQVCPGAIIAMHDVNPANTDALPRIIEFLHANGYEIVSLKDLLGLGSPAQ
jgi:peptidoglycan/xylan/chitin deacetylase (PgdA/CDA1 family)